MDKLLKKMEDMDPDERHKLREFLREKNKKEKEGPDMSWMYKTAKPDTEEYLLGRRIDKYVDEEEEKEQEQMKDAPGALFKDAMARRADLDMQAKMREDPLYAIKQREEEAKRRLLENPIKMKQLQAIVEKSKPKSKKKKKEKKKKHKKKSSSTESEESDDDLVKKYLEIVKNKKHKKDSDTASHKSKSDMKLKRNDSDSDHDHGRKGKKTKDHSSERKNRKRRQSSSEEDTRRSSKSGSSKSAEKSRKRHDSSSSSEEESARDSERKKVVPRGYGLIVPEGSESGKRPRQQSPVRKAKEKTPPRRPEPRRKLTEEEKEARRREMMRDAEERDVQREKNVKRYREDDAREEEAVSRHSGRKEDFINPLMMKHAASSSVEDRIKRNRHHIQRTKSALE